ncbi:MAG: hypothetical protein AAF821_07440 [Cyanobacteria bacterium P01_D01_bin.156]
MLKVETTVQIDVVQGAIDQAAGYLINNLQKNGMFRYRINTNSGVKLRPKYNILHHAGCVYALSLYNQYCPSENVRRAVKTSANYLSKEAVQPIPGSQTTLAVWARPEMHNTTRPLQAGLDGAGTGLLAFLSLHTIQKEVVSIEYLQALGRFIVYMQQGDKSFYARYIPLFGGKKRPQSLKHYPMEATLGLLMLHEKDRYSIWLETACVALESLVRHGKPASMADINPWTLLAISKLLSFNSKVGMPMPKELLVAYATRVCELLLRQQIDTPRQPHYSGGFSKDGVTLPTAAWIEGLLAALTFLPVNTRLTKQIHCAVRRGINFLLQAQIRDGEWAGAIPRAVGPLRSRRAAAIAFNQRATEVRIDYVQYAMRAWMKYVSLAPVLSMS